MEDKRHCPHCGRPQHQEPYLMAIRREKPIIPPLWAVVLIAAIVFTAIVIAAI